LRVLLLCSLDHVSSPIATLLRAIVRANPEISFTSFSGARDEQDREEGTRLWRLPNLRKASLQTFLLSPYDVVHHASATFKNYLPARFLHWYSRGRCRHVFTLNCEPYPTHPRLGWLIRSIRDCCYLISVSQAVSRGAWSETGRTSDRIIPNGYDPTLYLPGEQSLLSAHGRYLLFASSLLDRKRPDFFLEVAQRMPDVCFVMVGAQRPGDFSASIVQRASAAENVDYKGAVPRLSLRDLMQGATLLLHPSEHEGLPLTVIEAMACGLPVLAQPRSSLPEVVRDGVNGWLLPASDPEVWCRRIREFLSQSGVSEVEFRAGTAASVRARFEWSGVGRQYGDAYREALQRTL